jgi:hypothetical protein
MQQEHQPCTTQTGQSGLAHPLCADNQMKTSTGRRLIDLSGAPHLQKQMA